MTNETNIRDTMMTTENKQNSGQSERSDNSQLLWQPIETAPKGNGDKVDDTTSPDYIEPPLLLLALADGAMSIGRWDWYYSELGRGHIDGVSAWTDDLSGEQLGIYHAEPTHWAPLPDGP